MDKLFNFKEGQIILVKYYDVEEKLVLVHQDSQWYNGNWEHIFVQILPPTSIASTVVIQEWEIGCGSVKVLEDGSTLKLLYGKKDDT